MLVFERGLVVKNPNEGVNEGDDLIALSDAPSERGETVGSRTEQCTSTSTYRLKGGRGRVWRCGQTER